MKVLTDNAKLLAFVTIIMSIPLFLSYNIKYVVFPEGLAFGLLYFWGLASVPLVPILLFSEIMVLRNLLAASDAHGRSLQLIVYTLVAIFMAITSFIVFLVVRILL